MDDIVSVTITPYTRVNKVDVAGSSNSYYYEKDHLWSIIKITSSTGWIIDEYSYTVFWKAYKKNPDWIYKPVSSLKSWVNNTRLYTGREYDRETNLYYLRARYYDANMGRFISRDPIWTKDNVNLYTYVANSPINYVDRMGTEKVLIIWFAWRDPYSYWELSEKQYLQQGIAQVLNVYKNIKNTTVIWYNSSATKLWSEKWDAINYIIENKGKFNKIVLVWHSLWADNVIEIAKELKNEWVNINLLLTVDLQAVNSTNSISDNVKVAKNYYQTNWNSVVNWDPLVLGENNSSTNLVNQITNDTCYDGKCTNINQSREIFHTTIDDELEGVLVNDIHKYIY